MTYQPSWVISICNIWHWVTQQYCTNQLPPNNPRNSNVLTSKNILSSRQLSEILKQGVLSSWFFVFRIPLQSTEIHLNIWIIMHYNNRLKLRKSFHVMLWDSIKKSKMILAKQWFILSSDSMSWSNLIKIRSKLFTALFGSDDIALRVISDWPFNEPMESLLPKFRLVSNGAKCKVP